MAKPKLLYASPFPPMQSGISDYSVALVHALSEKFDITLYTDDYVIQEDSLKGFPVLKHGIDDIDFQAFQYKIYNIGNSIEFHRYIYEVCMEHPGMIILHDMVIYFLFMEYYRAQDMMFSKLYQEAGIEKFLEIRDMMIDRKTDLEIISKVPLNGELLRTGNKFMVHSWYTYNNVLASGFITEDRIKKINLISPSPKTDEEISREELFRKFNVPKDALIITSFGHIVGTKLNVQACRAIKNISERNNQKICYVMVGGGTAADEYLEDEFIIKTGYTELDEFRAFMDYSDLIINMRYPSMGETSAAMLQILQKGKPCITNNGGWFSELPEECVCKVELDDIVGNLEKAIENFVNNPEERLELGKRAKDHFDREYNPKVIAQNIFHFLTGVV